MLPPNGYGLHIQVVKKYMNYKQKLPFAFGWALLTVTTGLNFAVQYLSVCQMILLSGQDGLNVVVV